MFSNSDIQAKAWFVREVVNLVMQKNDLHVERIFLIGSYATGKPNDWSDIDYLVQLNKPMKYPTWQQIQEVHTKLMSDRIHVIFGSEPVQQSLKTPYKEIQLPGETHVAYQSSVA